VVRETAAASDPATWLSYSILAWAAGGNVNPVSNLAWRNALEQYVTDGGRLLIEGGELGYDHRYNTSFRQNVLHMLSWSAHGGGDVQVLEHTHPLATVPTVLDPIIPVLAGQNADRDAVAPMNDARTVLDWTTRPGKASVIAYDDDELEGNGGQVAALFAACDVLDDSGGQARAVMENLLDWLIGNDLPYLLFDGHAVMDGDLGNGDGVADPGETLGLAVDLRNLGSCTDKGTWVRATSDQPSRVHFVDNFATWPAIPSAGSAPSETPHFVLRITEDTPCGTVIGITLEVTTAEGFSAERHFSFKVGTGGGLHQTYSMTETAGIPNPGTLDSVIDVSDAFLVGDINCSVDIQHSHTSLITVLLRSAQGTEVTLHDGDDHGDHLSTTYDSQTQPHGPGSMSDYDGEVAPGDWHLLVTDHTGDMLWGVLNSWSLDFDTADWCHDLVCEEPVPGPVDHSLRMSRISGTDVHLEWDPMGEAAGYNVWRSRHPDLADAETAGSSGGPALDEVGLPQAATVYYYQVRAENACREEGP
jgi:subtilisin-like proprotein convertase family protein